MTYGQLPVGALVGGRKITNRMPGIIVNGQRHVRITFADGTGDVFLASASVPTSVRGEPFPAGPVRAVVQGRTARRMPNGAPQRERFYVWK